MEPTRATSADHLADLGVGVLLSGGYYLAASSVFPTNPESHKDLDSYYWEHKREVLGIILCIAIAVQIIAYVLGRPITTLAFAINASLFGAMALACFARGRLLNLMALSFMITVMVANFSIL